MNCRGGQRGQRPLAGSAPYVFSLLFPDPSKVAGFAMMVSTMGSGKTSTVLAAVLRVLMVGWDACRAGFEEWKSETVNGDPTRFPLKCHSVSSMKPIHSTALARLVVIVTTTSTVDQWHKTAVATARRNFGGEVDVFLCLTKREATAIFKKVRASPQDRPRVVVVLPDGLKAYFTSFWDIGCCAVVIDEIATHFKELPTGNTPGDKPFPSVYRLIGLSATPKNLLSPDTDRWGTPPIPPAPSHCI